MVNIFRAKCFKLSVNISYKMHQIVKRNTWYRAIDSRNESALLKFVHQGLMINDDIVVGDEDVDRQVVEDDGDLSMAGEADSGKDL